jgi:glutamate--cysteine ligase
MDYQRAKRVGDCMSLDAPNTHEQPVTGVDDLLAYFRSAEQPTGTRLVGLEHEKFIYPVGGTTPVPYEGERGIGALLAGFAAFGWEPFREGPDGPLIAMTRGAAALSLEPGGQLELSGSPWGTAREAHQENLEHLKELKELAAARGLRAVTLGYRPVGRLDEMPWMPKGRYKAMRQTLSQRGRLAPAMMLMTATGQVSLDYENEGDCVRKLEVAARVMPVLVALYANSPYAEGHKSGYLSWRSRVWNEVDPSRCGYPKFMFDGSASYRTYIEWALDAPLLFLRRQGQYLIPQLTFRQLLREGYDGRPALYDDWVDHVSTLFPEVRIKKVLEVRSPDCASPAMTGALVALMRGLLYDSQAMYETGRLFPPRSRDEHMDFHHRAQQGGLAALWKGRTYAGWADELIGIASRGLKRLDAEDEPLLDPLKAMAERGHSLAEDLLAHGPEAALDAGTV